MKKLYITAVLTELFGIALISAGLTYEWLTGADLGYIIITAGSLICTVGSFIFAKVVSWMKGDNYGRVENKKNSVDSNWNM